MSDMTTTSRLRDVLLRVLHRDLGALHREILAYPDDAALWRVVPGIANPGGTLALHLSGNLRHFVGATLGGTGYTRDRPAEFASRDLTRADVAAQVADALAQVTRTLQALDPAALDGTFPAPVGPGLTLDTTTMLVHIATHTAYHLGQIDYHRRMVSGDGTTVDTISLPPLLAPVDALAPLP
jgi:uncharacterized damage-inducible protein DinB